MSFSLFVFSNLITAAVFWALGYRAGHEDGADDGFDDGYDFATGDGEVRWRLTAQGVSALDADREPLAELSMHQPTDPGNFSGVYFDHTTRTFKKP